MYDWVLESCNPPPSVMEPWSLGAGEDYGPPNPRSYPPKRVKRKRLSRACYWPIGRTVEHRLSRSCLNWPLLQIAIELPLSKAEYRRLSGGGLCARMSE